MPGLPPFWQPPTPMPSVAVLGASPSPSKFGNKSVRAFAAAGWTVFPIHPREPAVEGLPCLASISVVPVKPDVVSAYLPPPILLQELPGIAAKGCGELWLNPGTDHPEVIREARALGLTVVCDCSLLRIGRRPDEFP